MPESLNAVGFVFNKVKTLIKKDNLCKYSTYNCQDCAWTTPGCQGYSNPLPGTINPCNACTNNSQYKIAIFKLKKEHFISSSLEVSTGTNDAWEQFKHNIMYQRNGNFVISVTKCNKSHSFYANLIKAKKCKCCESVLLYFKYNIIGLLSNCDNTQSQYYNYLPGQCCNPPPLQNSPYVGNLNSNTNVFTNTNNLSNPNTCNPYLTASANINGNITYDLKSDEYYNVKFFYSPIYQFTPTLQTCC